MASSNSLSLNKVEENDFKIAIPLFKTLGFTHLVDKIHRGIFRVKVNRNFVHFSGLKFFGLKRDGEIGGYDSVNRIHISVYEGSQRMKLGETNVICQLTSETREIEHCIDKAVRLEPGIEYEIRYEYSGPKVRFGKNRTSEQFQHYNTYVGTIGFSVEMIQGKNSRVAELIFTANGFPQLDPYGTAPVELESLKIKQNVEIHSDYAMKETIEEYSKHLVELKFRCNKRIVIDGMFFNGWSLPSDAERKTYLIEKLEIVEAATKFDLSSLSERWRFTVPPELKIPLHFIDHTPIAPDVWHILKMEFNGPVMRYGTKPRSTISLDSENGENVVWTFDLENSKNTETLHSLVYQFSKDQSKQTASPDQEC